MGDTLALFMNFATVFTECGGAAPIARATPRPRLQWMPHGPRTEPPSNM